MVGAAILSQQSRTKAGPLHLRSGMVLEYIASRRLQGGSGYRMVLAAQELCRLRGYVELFSAVDRGQVGFAFKGSAVSAMEAHLRWGFQDIDPEEWIERRFCEYSRESSVHFMVLPTAPRPSGPSSITNGAASTAAGDSNVAPSMQQPGFPNAEEMGTSDCFAPGVEAGSDGAPALAADCTAAVPVPGPLKRWMRQGSVWAETSPVWDMEQTRTTETEATCPELTLAEIQMSQKSPPESSRETLGTDTANGSSLEMAERAQAKCLAGERFSALTKWLKPGSVWEQPECALFVSSARAELPPIKRWLRQGSVQAAPATGDVGLLVNHKQGGTLPGWCPTFVSAQLQMSILGEEANPVRLISEPKDTPRPSDAGLASLQPASTSCHRGDDCDDSNLEAFGATLTKLSEQLSSRESQAGSPAPLHSTRANCGAETMKSSLGSGISDLTQGGELSPSSKVEPKQFPERQALNSPKPDSKDGLTARAPTTLLDWLVKSNARARLQGTVTSCEGLAHSPVDQGRGRSLATHIARPGCEDTPQAQAAA